MFDFGDTVARVSGRPGPLNGCGGGFNGWTTPLVDDPPWLLVPRSLHWLLPLAVVECVGEYPPGAGSILLVSLSMSHQLTLILSLSLLFTNREATPPVTAAPNATMKY